MELTRFAQNLSKKARLPLPADHNRRVEACLAVQIHTTGARPAYEVNGRYIEPETYHRKYDTLFKTRLLNRHPNEAPTHYNWRLSVYSPVAKELYDKFSNLCKGAILQPNNYSISGGPALTEWIARADFGHTLSRLCDFVLQNPYGYLAVLPMGEYSSTESPDLRMVMIPCEAVIMHDEDSMAFHYGGRVWFANAEMVAEFVSKTEYIEKPHPMGEMPVWMFHNTFLQPYQFWSDSLVRNMNDDEAMVKHYSYPIIQMVVQDCTQCQGSGKCIDTASADYDPTDPGTFRPITCTTCDGRGTMTRNPGEFMTISEETLARNGGTMQDMAKFITPDVGIPEYHLKRWQTFYERVEAALYLRVVQGGTQSGEAKREDRKDQYYFLQTVSNFIFAQVKHALRVAQLYLTDGRQEPVYIVAPKQFDLMSDSDIVNEFARLQALTDDSQTLSELAYVVNNKVYRDDPVQLKINEVLYMADPLYGVSGNALRQKILSGVYTDLDKTIHEKGYKLLVRMAARMTADAFTAMPVEALIQQLTQEAQGMLPQGIYGDFAAPSSAGGNTLKESVGGLTGMIEIAKAVASGLYDLDAAVALVSDRFGLTEEEARRQLGTPQLSATQVETTERLL